MSEMETGSSRRQFVATLGAVAAATVVLPQLTGSERSARAGDVKEDWFATIKPEELKAGSAKSFKKNPDTDDEIIFILARQENTIYALSSMCTHKGCKVLAGEELQKSAKKPADVDPKDALFCPCHKGQFDFQGNPTKEPPKLPLARYAIRLNKEGVIEVDLGATIGQEAGSIEIK